MGYVGLMEAGFLKFVISQNVDGLHRKSGIPGFKIAELHGNTNLEKCSQCGRQYMRDFRVRTAQHVKDHKTGRLCDDSDCKGILNDSIINFGENLPSDELESGYTNSESADLCLVMGTSCRVSPANDMPRQTVMNGGKLVICNLQKTPLDSMATLNIFAKCDDIMDRLCEKLGIPIKPFKLERLIEF
jgi:NAD-dependent SIR2 family protein deacetylase